MIWTKGTNQSAKFQIFDGSRNFTKFMKFHQICTLIGCFCWKYIKFQLKRYKESCLMTKFFRLQRVIKNLKKNWFVVSKRTRIWWILTWALEMLKISTLIDFFWAKYVTFDLKKYRIWRKTDLWFRKWHEEYSKFSPEHSKVSKLGLWYDPFIQSRKCMNLKFTEELCVMIMKNDAKFEEELTNYHNLTNFARALECLKFLKFSLAL